MPNSPFFAKITGIILTRRGGRERKDLWIHPCLHAGAERGAPADRHAGLWRSGGKHCSGEIVRKGLQQAPLPAVGAGLAGKGCIGGEKHRPPWAQLHRNSGPVVFYHQKA